MAQFTIEIATIVTAVAICTILAVYLFILKKNGWLGTGSKLYLCPNQECKKVFQKPVELKDLSETPISTYLACPHCGTNLEKVLASYVERKGKFEAKIPFRQRKTETKMEHSTSIPKVYLNKHNDSTRENNLLVDQANKDLLKIEAGKPYTVEQTDSFRKKSLKPSSEKTIMFEQVHTSPPKKAETVSSQDQATEIGSLLTSSSGCQYGYGYLSQREKDEGIPATCIECPKSLDCMLSEYYQKRDSVKEIKKWYNL